MTNRVVRSSGWNSKSRFLQSANRNRVYADVAFSSQGFRLLQESAKSSYLVMRGGSWDDLSDKARYSYRDGYHPNLRNYYLGFRLVQEVSND